MKLEPNCYSWGLYPEDFYFAPSGNITSIGLGPQVLLDGEYLEVLIFNHPFHIIFHHHAVVLSPIDCIPLFLDSPLTYFQFFPNSELSKLF